jgi:hypothetical protein
VLLVGLLVGLWLGAPGRAGADTGADLAALIAGLPACGATRAHCFGIQLHVTVAGDGPIAHADWLAVQLAAANRHFAALGVGFQVVGIDALPASCARVATRGERDEVAHGRLTGEVIHVFITGRLDDIDQPGGIIRGVTWHVRGGDRKYVILSTVAPDRVLAHELGHVFGLPHSTYAISIMNKTERAEPPPEQRTFADDEIAAMRPVLKRLLRDRIIADVAHPTGE